MSQENPEIGDWFYNKDNSFSYIVVGLAGKSLYLLYGDAETGIDTASTKWVCNEMQQDFWKYKGNILPALYEVHKILAEET